ncbi:MAG TPA: DUF58 domain-containing protein [Kofleriaceae bacterium]|nr:DUF58 domain-containing protein [Kofleriaceae bacterium]
MRRRWQRRPSARRLSFTREGKILVFLSIGVGFAAINTGNNLLYLLLGWMLSFIIASGVLSEQTLKKLVVTRRPPPKIFASEPFLMEVVIENKKPKRASYSIEVEDLQGKTPIDKRCYFLKIPEGKSQRTSYRHTFVRRGLYTLTGYRLATKFPFALFRKSRDVDAPLDLLVYPARVAVPRPPPRSATRGDAIADRLGRRGEFFGLREHRAGDDRRDVHWKSSARSGRLLVREYEDELARRLVIAVDNALPAEVRDAVNANAQEHDGEPAPIGPWSNGFGAMTPAFEEQVSAVERAISIAASLAAAYLEVGWTVELVARGSHVQAGTGRQHEARIAKALAILPYVGDDVAFAPLPKRVESVLVTPRGVVANGRPATHTVMDA